jgi:hypothetical protein
LSGVIRWKPLRTGPHWRATGAHHGASFLGRAIKLLD